MSGEKGKTINIYQSPKFEKAFNRLNDKHKDIVDDEIELLSKKPELGVKKKGDLSHLWVHKFKLDGQEILLGYSWDDSKLELYLLNLGLHENFYRDAKKRRAADLKIIN